MSRSQKFLLLLTSLVYLFSLYATLTRVGLTWDEVEYFRYGTHYTKWFSEPQKIENIDKYWSINHESPPLVKLLGGFSHLILNEKLHLAGNIFSYRFFIPILGLALFLAIFYFTASIIDVEEKPEKTEAPRPAGGRRHFTFDLTKNFWSGLFASLAFFSMPRLFGQAHFLALDFPVTVFIFLTAYGTFKSIKSWKWGVAAAIFWGLALLTKFNAFVGIIPILIYILVACSSISKKNNRVKLNFAKFCFRVFLFLCSFVFLILFWPWLWKDTFNRLIDYFNFYLRHDYMFTFYFGKIYSSPPAPWHYPWVMTAITIPVITLVLSIIGAIRILRRKESILILGSIFFALSMLSLPSVPKYNGERLFLQIFPFIAVLTGLGFGQLMEVINFRRGFYRPSARSLRSLAQGSRMTELTKGLCFCVFVFFCFCDLYRSHPYYLSYYNFLVGDKRTQFETDYWGHSQVGMLDYLNKNLKRDASFTASFLLEPFQWYQKDGLLRQDIKIKKSEELSNGESFYLAIFQCESWFGEKADPTSWWNFIKNHKPIFVLEHRGLLLARLYYFYLQIKS